MKIVICDDNAQCREETAALVREYIRQRDRHMDLAVFSCPVELLEEARRAGGFDIYLLDVLMPRINGIELGMQLRQWDFDSKILYLTSSTDYAIAAFKAKASDYLLKPVKREELFQALDDAVASLASRREKGIFLKTRESNIRLSYDSILYAQLEKKAVVYHLTNGKTVVGAAIRTGFSEAVQELLQEGRFALCGKSLVVNLYHIHAVETEMIRFRTGDQTYIGRRASRELRSAWADFWINREESQ